jgi:hypothetical protein
VRNELPIREPSRVCPLCLLPLPVLAKADERQWAHEAFGCPQPRLWLGCGETVVLEGEPVEGGPFDAGDTGNGRAR